MEGSRQGIVSSQQWFPLFISLPGGNVEALTLNFSPPIPRTLSNKDRSKFGVAAALRTH
jgi:hypothetical protein